VDQPLLCCPASSGQGLGTFAAAKPATVKQLLQFPQIYLSGVARLGILLLAY
jgi:hypothetical protein